MISFIHNLFRVKVFHAYWLSFCLVSLHYFAWTIEIKSENANVKIMRYIYRTKIIIDAISNEMITELENTEYHSFKKNSC